MKLLYFCLGIVSLATVGFGQQKPGIRPLAVGDTVPDIEFTDIFNYHSPTARLSDFKGKLVIFDFWATWCSSCITAFPGLDALQDKYKEQLQVLLVNSANTGDSRTRIVDFFEKRRSTGRPIMHLPSAIGDSAANALFPHATVPHYIWLVNGTVKAITSSAAVTEQNIKSILNQPGFRLPAKKDFYGNRFLDLSDKITIDDVVQYSFFVKGKIDVGTINQFRLDNSLPRGKIMVNVPILEMYKEVLNMAEMKKGSVFDEKRMILDMKDPYALSGNMINGSKEEWEKEHLYSYDIVVPRSDIMNLPGIMLEGLNKYSGYFGRTEKRQTRCLLLVKTGSGPNIHSSGNKPDKQLLISECRYYLHNQPISLLVNELNRIPGIKIPIINETGIEENIDIRLTPASNSLPDIRKALRFYGLDLVETRKELELFILSDNKTVN